MHNMFRKNKIQGKKTKQRTSNCKNKANKCPRVKKNTMTKIKTSMNEFKR